MQSRLHNNPTPDLQNVSTFRRCCTLASSCRRKRLSRPTPSSLDICSCARIEVERLWSSGSLTGQYVVLSTLMQVMGRCPRVRERSTTTVENDFLENGVVPLPHLPGFGLVIDRPAGREKNGLAVPACPRPYNLATSMNRTLLFMPQHRPRAEQGSKRVSATRRFFLHWDRCKKKGRTKGSSLLYLCLG